MNDTAHKLSFLSLLSPVPLFGHEEPPPSAMGSGSLPVTHSFLSMGTLPHQDDTTPSTLHTKPNIVPSGKHLPGSPRLSTDYTQCLPTWLRVLSHLSIYPEVWQTLTIDFKCLINVAYMTLSSPLHASAECLIPPDSSVELNKLLIGGKDCVSSSM